MGQVLESLHRLQGIEIQLAEIRRDRDSKVRRVKLRIRRVRVADEEILTYKNTSRQRQIRLDALQLDVTARETAIDKHRQALNKAKTNKEYAAILTALNTEKADNSKFETEMLQLMDQIQKVTDQVADLEAEKSKLSQEQARAEEAVAAFDAEHKAQSDDLCSRRTECAAGLRAFDRDIAGVIANPVILPVRMIVLFVDNNQSQSVALREQTRSGAEHNRDITATKTVPGIIALTLGHG